jgi:predicted glycosyltransferase involved in capsule biosynthesis
MKKSMTVLKGESVYIKNNYKNRQSLFTTVEQLVQRSSLGMLVLLTAKTERFLICLMGKMRPRETTVDFVVEKVKKK